jgi:hypothetical protein
MTKFKTVKRTRKRHECYNCFKTIEIGSTCTYGVTTDSDIVQNGGIVSGYFCTECRDVTENK